MPIISEPTNLLSPYSFEVFKKASIQKRLSETELFEVIFLDPKLTDYERMIIIYRLGQIIGQQLLLQGELIKFVDTK